jgi:hypothetical protein
LTLVQTVSCYAKQRLLPDSFSGGLNCLLNTCDYSASVVGGARSPPASINSLLALLFSSLIFRSSITFFFPPLLLQPAMGRGKRGRGWPRRGDNKRKRAPSPPSEDFWTQSTRRRHPLSQTARPLWHLPRCHPRIQMIPWGFPPWPGHTGAPSSAQGSVGRTSRGLLK